MPDITIIVRPAFNSRGQRQHDHVDAYLPGTGELICISTRQPLLDGARALLGLGYDPSDVIRMAWEHSPQVESMPARIGIAAQYDVMGDRFVRRKSAPSARKQVGKTSRSVASTDITTE